MRNPFAVVVLVALSACGTSVDPTWTNRQFLPLHRWTAEASVGGVALGPYAVAGGSCESGVLWWTAEPVSGTGGAFSGSAGPRVWGAEVRDMTPSTLVRWDAVSGGCAATMADDDSLGALVLTADCAASETPQRRPVHIRVVAVGCSTRGAR